MRTVRATGVTIVMGGLALLAGCNRPTADAQAAAPGTQAAPASGRVNPGPVDNRPIDNGPLPESPGGAAGSGSATPPGRPVDSSATSNGAAAAPPTHNPAPAPGSNANGAGGAQSTYGRGGSGSSLSPAVSGRSPYEGTAGQK